MNNEYLEDFILYLKDEKRYSINTINSYSRDLKLFFEYIKKEGIDSINYIDIQSYLSNLYLNGLSKTSISRKLSSIKSYGRFLNKYKGINCDFLNNIVLPKKDKLLPEYLHEDELDKLLNLPINNLLEIRNSLIINLLYSSGLRLSELTSLKVSDYNKDENIFNVIGKGNKERIVIYSNKTKELLELYLKTRKDYSCDFLFINKNGKKLSNRGVETILKNISLKYLGHDKLHPHMLRHTFASNLLNNGMDIRVLQELLGHDSLNATQVYTHIAKKELTKAYQKYHPRVDKHSL